MSHHSDLSLSDFTTTGDADEFAQAYPDEARLMSAPATLTFTREIRYNKFNRDYDMLLDGEYRGSRATYSQAEEALDQLEYDLLQSGITATARELDGGSDAEEIAADYASLTHCPTCDSDYAGPVCARCWQPDGPRLTFSQLITLVVNGPDDPAPPIDDGPSDNWGGWRAPENAVGWGIETPVSWGS